MDTAPTAIVAIAVSQRERFDLVGRAFSRQPASSRLFVAGNQAARRAAAG
jgi:hypothetical protein